MTNLYERVVSITGKPPDQRTDHEIEQLLPWFRKKSDLFKPLRTEIVHDIVKNCQFLQCERDYVIIKQADKGDCFYIILSGTVAVYINTTLADEDDSDKKRIEEDTDSEDDEKKSSKKAKRLDRSKFGNYIAKIDAGKSFGELALINPDCIRNASIISEETTDLLVVNRDLYNRSLHSFQAREFEERKRFVEEFPLFSNWQPRYKKQVAMSLRKEKISFEGNIVKQGQAINGVLFLLSGQAKIVADPTQHPVQYPNFFPLVDIEDLERVEARESLLREMNMAPSKSDKRQNQNLEPGKSPQNHENKNGKKLSRHVEMCLMGAVEVVGDLELTMGLTTYAQSVYCTEEADLFILDHRNYERLMEKRNPQAVEMMRDAARTKLKLRMSWLADKEVPLFKYFLYKLEEKEREKERNEQRKQKRSDDPSKVKLDWKTDRGPLIDLHGPGSVFYSIRQRDKARKKAMARLGPPTSRFGAILRKAAPRNHGGTDLAKGFALRSFDFVLTNMALQDVRDGQDLEQSAALQNGHASNNDSESRVVCENGRTPGQGEGTSNGHDNVDDDFRDWQSSDHALSQLESKIQAWHSNFEDESKAAKRTVKLHRFCVEESKRPKPGTKVIVRQRGKPSTFHAFQEHSTGGSRWKQENFHSYVIEKAGEQARPKTTGTSSRRAPPSSAEKQKRPKSWRHFTSEEYQELKGEMHRRIRSYKPLLDPTRPSSALSPMGRV